MQMLGCQFDPAKIKSIYDELERIKKSKRDFVVPNLRLFHATTPTGPTLQIMGNEAGKAFRVGDADDAAPEWFTDWREAEEAAERSGKPLTVLEGDESLRLTRAAGAQLYDRLRVPVRFASYLTESGHGDVLDDLVNQLLSRSKGRCLVRCAENRVRAVLSDRYRITDNEDVLLASAGALEGSGAQVWKLRLSEDRFEIFAVSGRISGEVRLDRPIDGYRWRGEQGDAHNAAAWITNSETGKGGTNVRPSVMRAVCANFKAWGDSLRTIHLGVRMEDGIVYSDETIASEQKAVWLRLRDAIQTVFDAEAFQAYIDRLNGITQQRLGDEIQAVDRTLTVFRIPEDRKAAILGALFGSADSTRYGLVQAMTQAAHQWDESDPEAAGQLETAASLLIDMPDGEFADLVGAGARRTV